MNCPENENVCSVRKEDGSGYYRLHTIWKPNGFRLNVASKTGAWRGEMTEDDVKEVCGQLDMNGTEYLKQCKEALTTPEGLRGMVYAVENGSFVWKKTVDEDSGVKLRMGWVMLQPSNFVDTIQGIVDVALQCNAKLMKEVNQLHKTRENDNTEKKALLDKIDEILMGKDEMESDLYGRFLVLLNSKKKKIAELEERLESGTSRSKSAKGETSYQNPYEVQTDEDTDVTPEEIADSDMMDVQDSTSSSASTHYSENETEMVETTAESKGVASTEEPNKPPAPDEEVKETEVKKEPLSPRIPNTKQDLLEYFYGS